MLRLGLRIRVTGWIHVGMPCEGLGMAATSGDLTVRTMGWRKHYALGEDKGDGLNVGMELCPINVMAGPALCTRQASRRCVQHFVVLAWL